MNAPTKSSVAIVGAGFAGLSLAIALKQRGFESIAIFESRSGDDDDDGGTSYVVGDLFLPNGKESMRRLGMSDVWENLTRGSKTGRPNYIPQEGLQSSMRSAVSKDIYYGHRVTGIRNDKEGEGLFVHGTQRRRNAGRKDKGTEIRRGPFDVVAGADGVISCIRKCSGSGRTLTSHSNIALLGDGRWCQDRFDLGSRRIKCGADIALQDGIELASLLASQDGSNLNLAKFCARNKRMEILVRRMNVAVVILAILLWQQFPFDGRKTNVAPLVFVSAIIHIGGEIRLRLPVSVSEVPITLHTLAACFGGMALGPGIGCQGAILYASLWAIYNIHARTNIHSFGYVMGLVPCAIASGALCIENLLHPILAAAVGQSCTLLLGVLWLIVVSSDPSMTITQALRRGALPFLPGLLIKSIIAWLLAKNLGSMVN